MDAKEEIAVELAPPTSTSTLSPPNLMDKEEKTQLEAPKESELAHIPEITEENKTLKTKDQEEEDNAISESGTVKNIDVAVEEISGAEAAEESVKKEIKETLIAPSNATEEAAETTELVKEEAKDQSDDVAPISAGLVSETGETETTELVKEEAKDQSDDVAPISAVLVSETSETETTELVKEEAKDQSDDVAPISAVLVSETSETETTELVKEEAKDQSDDVAPISAVLVSEASETETTELVKEEARDQSEDVAPISAVLVSETGETETTELVKEEAKDQSEDVAPISAVLVSETGETETTELVEGEAKDQSGDVAPVSVMLVSESGEMLAIETTELVKEEAKDQSDDVSPVSVTLVSESGETVAAETTELVKEEAKDQSGVAPVSATRVSETGVALVTPNPEEQKQTEDLATPVAETHEEDKQGAEELVKEEIKETDLPNHATDTETIIDGTKDAGPIHEEENKVIEIVNLQQEAKLPEVQSEDRKLQDTSVAVTVGEEEEAENKDELVKQVIKESKLPDSSLAVTPVIDTTESMPETKTTDTDAGAVTEDVHTEKEKANSEELKVEINTDASPVLTESADVESEVAQVLPEKKKKRPLGDHLAEEKANDSSITANKQASDDKSEIEPSESEQTATAVAPKESTEISSRDANTTNDTKSEADEKKEEEEKATREVTKTESAQEGEGEKIAEKESAPAGKAAKEEVASKLTSRGSNNLLSKVKHQIVKVKKAIVRKSPSSKNMPVENKDDIKVK